MTASRSRSSPLTKVCMLGKSSARTAGDLQSRRRPFAGAFGKERGTVAADHFDPRTFAEPGCERRRLAVRQQVYWSAALDLDQHGPVDPTVAHRVFVDANYPRSPWLWLREGIDQPQHGVTTDRDPEDIRDAGTGSASEREADLGQYRPQPFGPPAVSAGKPRDLFGERPPFARSNRAGEPPDLQRQHHAPSRTGQIGREPQVGAVHSVRPDSTARAQSAACPTSDPNTDHLAVFFRRHHRNLRSRQEQQLLQTEHDLVHGLELSAKSWSWTAVFGLSPQNQHQDQQSRRVCAPQKLIQNPNSSTPPVRGTGCLPDSSTSDVTTAR